MTLNEALDYFGTGYKLCKKLGITPTNYSTWKRRDFIPIKRQLMINMLIEDELPIDIDKESMDRRIKIARANS
jgi:hypothetical protein